MTVPPTVLKGQEWIMPAWGSDVLSYWKDSLMNQKTIKGFRVRLFNFIEAIQSRSIAASSLDNSQLKNLVCKKDTSEFTTSVFLSFLQSIR